MYSVVTMEHYDYNRKHTNIEMVSLTYFLNVYADFYCLYIDKHITKHINLHIAVYLDTSVVSFSLVRDLNALL